MMPYAAEVGADRVELYTEPYAKAYAEGMHEQVIVSFLETAEEARKNGLGVNAGHDLDLNNLKFFHDMIPWLDEVSIGHALISDALYYGLENTVQLYLKQLK
jgi:pyridoxine 5-phosphate synthase